MIDGTETPWRNPKNEKQQDGIEERATAMIDKPFGVRSMESLMVDFAQAETATLSAKLDAVREALGQIQHITDGHGCGRYQVLCSACEAKRIATEALLSEE